MKQALPVLLAASLVAGVIVAQHTRPIPQATEAEVSSVGLAVTFHVDGGCTVVPAAVATGNAGKLKVVQTRRVANAGFCAAARAVANKSVKLDYAVGDGSTP